VYRIPAAGGTPQLVMRFDVPRLRPYSGGSPSLGNSLIYFVLVELESDIYVMDLVRK
jgi:hypothetical protein